MFIKDCILVLNVDWRFKLQCSLVPFSEVDIDFFFKKHLPTPFLTHRSYRLRTLGARVTRWTVTAVIIPLVHTDPSFRTWIRVA